MQKLLIEVDHQDQVYVEEECAKHGHTLSTFFKKLLDDYKGRPAAKEGQGVAKVAEDEKPIEEPPKARRGRKAKTD